MSRGLWLCRGCRRQVSVTSGTIFQDRKLPLTSWFRAMGDVTSQKNGVSALGLQRVLGMGSYKTAWALLHKLRRAMVRPGRDRLTGRVEVDETYWGADKERVVGRLTYDKALIAIAAEQEGRAIGRIRLRRISNLTKAVLHGFIAEAVEPGSTVITDGLNLLFAPPVYEIYPAGHEHTTTVEVADLSGILCGAFRPGHFTGVATVVTKLLNIVAPDVAVFGEKDFQQLIVIRRLVADLCLPVEILGGPTIRDHDGLALSSRNKYLSPRERDLAPKLYESLKLAKQRIEKGEHDFGAIEQGGMQQLERAGFQPEYFAIRQATDLAQLRAESRDLIVLAAARLGKARLIDNMHARIIERH